MISSVISRVSALVLVKATGNRAAALSLAVPFSVMAIVYGTAMLREPFEKHKS